MIVGHDDGGQTDGSKHGDEFGGNEGWGDGELVLRFLGMELFSLRN